MKDVLLEGFWDSLINGVKQGYFAALGTVSASHRGKLSASLLSSELFNQYKEWVNKSGLDNSADTMRNFLLGMNFSDQFADRFSTTFGSFLQDPEHKIVSAQKQNQTVDQEQMRSYRQEKQRSAAQNARDEMDKNDAVKAEKEKEAKEKEQAAQSEKMNTQTQMQQRMQQKKAFGPRAKTRRESEEIEGALLNEAIAVISDFQLRKFFDVMAKAAFSTGEAKSAAKKSINAARIEPNAQPHQTPQQQQQQPAPAPQGAPAHQTAPETPATKSAPTAPAPAPALDLHLSSKEQALLDRYGLTMINQVGAADPEVGQLAKKIIRQALAATNQELRPAKPANDDQSPTTPDRKPAGTNQ